MANSQSVPAMAGAARAGVGLRAGELANDQRSEVSSQPKRCAARHSGSGTPGSTEDGLDFEINTARRWSVVGRKRFALGRHCRARVHCLGWGHYLAPRAARSAADRTVAAADGRLGPEGCPAQEKV